MEINKVAPSDNDDDSCPPSYGTALQEPGRFPPCQTAGQPGVQGNPTGTEYGETAAAAAAAGPALAPGYAHYPPPNVMQAWMQPPPSYFPPAAGSAQPLNPYYPVMIMYGPPPPQYNMFTVSQGSQHHHQPQQQVVVYGGGDMGQQPVIVSGVNSYCGQIMLSCFVFWCCNCLLGLIAFILAMVANSTAVSDPRSARQLGRASYSVSTVGIVLTVIIIIVVICIFNTATRTSCLYTYEGHCYDHLSTHSYDIYDCPGRYSYRTGYCYYN